MRIVITDDEGEEFAVVTDPRKSRHGIWAVTDDEGVEGVTLDSILQEALTWEVNR